MTPSYKIECTGDARETYFVDSEEPIETIEQAEAAIDGMRADLTEVEGVEVSRIEEIT